MKKKLTAILAALMCAALLVTCVSPVMAEEAAANDTLRVACLYTSGSFDPLQDGDGDKMVFHSLFDCLFKFDSDGSILPMLCTEYEQDGLEVTLHLRDDVTFSDGNPLTAKDVVFSFNRVMEDPTLSYNFLSLISGMDVVDDYTVAMHLLNGYDKWQNYLAELLYIVEEATYDPEADITTTAPIGSGPYTFEGQDEASTVFLKAREDYWGGAPEFKNVEVVAQMDDATALIALQTGEIDLIGQIGKAAYQQAGQDPNLVAWGFDSWACQSLMILVGDDAFRQAVFHAIDRDTMTLIVTEGVGVVAENMFARKIMGEYEDKVPFVGYDPELAKECLAKSEFDYSQPLTIEVFSDDAAAAAQCIQQDLAAIGITVEIAQEDLNTWYNNLMDGGMAMGMVEFGTDMVSVEGMITMFDVDGGGFPFNISEEFVEETKKVYTVAEEDRIELVTGLLQRMVDECPLVPLFDTPFYSVRNKRVGNVLDCSPATYVYYFGDMTIEE